ncbi:MAG: hypothetical protein CAPSK01_003711 [Candidatus Accumulibacter vicinus]|uniref:Uncharacterized protein n=1 Tax=Candidatus Accumulibacter vicinus TaxID=2954382 RepID=A0A084XWC9_9PROT|nr:MAG: hypothetical protein CAPSK01_003711 [Candidatus Accumulibacter vicinus]
MGAAARRSASAVAAGSRSVTSKTTASTSSPLATISPTTASAFSRLWLACTMKRRLVGGKLLGAHLAGWLLNWAPGEASIIGCLIFGQS